MTNQAINTPPKIVIGIPCFNEEITIAKVISDFQKAIPQAEIIVFDNNSTDQTAKIAQESGTTVIPEYRQGKGNVVQSMFKNIESDYFVMVDGDDTYSAKHVNALLQPLLDKKADMTVATRLQEYATESFRPLHIFGNNLVKNLVNWIFQSNLSDIMSGYRAYTREVVEMVPILSTGFEVETELTIRTLDQGFIIQEIPVPYQERPAGSFSKLHTFRDGFRVLSTILQITRSYKPFTFFGLLSLFFALIGLSTGTVVVFDYLEDSYVHKVPTAILATGCMMLSFSSLGVGMILNVMNHRFKEINKMLQRLTQTTLKK